MSASARIHRGRSQRRLEEEPEIVVTLERIELVRQPIDAFALSGSNAGCCVGHGSFASAQSVGGEVQPASRSAMERDVCRKIHPSLRYL